MKTIGEETQGIYVPIECKNCGHNWIQPLILDELLECGNECGVNVRLEVTADERIFITHCVNPATLNAQAIRHKISSAKIASDVESVNVVKAD